MTDRGPEQLTIQNYGTINFYGSPADGLVDQKRGITAEVAQDLGQTPASEEALDQESPEVEESRLQDRADNIAELEAARKLDRRTNLRRVLERSEEVVNRQGHLRSSNKPQKRAPIQIRHKRAIKEAEKSLELACGVCEFAGKCGLKGNYDKWLETKPYKQKGSVPKYFRPQVKTETRDEFRKRLDQDPGAHCNPKRVTKKAA